MKQIIEKAISDYPFGAEGVVDRRRKHIRAALDIGITDAEIISARMIKEVRRAYRPHGDQIKKIHENRVNFLSAAKRTVHNPEATSSRYNFTGVDWVAYNRASSNGKGWVLIAPDEPGNNMYTEDHILIRIMKRKAERNPSRPFTPIGNDGKVVKGRNCWVVEGLGIFGVDGTDYPAAIDHLTGTIYGATVDTDDTILDLNGDRIEGLKIKSQ